jgi:O-antigen/teichoic acid export membrane protein
MAPSTARGSAREVVARAERWIRADHLVRNSGWIIATTLVNLVLGYLYWIVAARLLGHAALGLATSLLALMNVATLLFAVGLGPALIATLPRLAAGPEWAATVNAALLAAAGIALLTSSALAVALPASSAAFAPLLDQPGLLVVFVVASVAWTTCTILDYAFVAERRSEFMFARNAAFSAAKIPALWVATLLASSTTTALLAGWAVTAAASSALGLLLLARGLTRRYRLALAGIVPAARDLRRQLAGHHVASVGAQLPIFVLPAIVAARLSVAENAYFYIGWAAAGVFFIVSPAVAASLFAEAMHDVEQLQRAVRRSAWTILALLGPAAVAFLVLGRTIMGVFGPSYPAHTLPLLLPLIASAAPDAITNVYVSVLRVRQRLRVAATLNVLIGATTLVLAWVLLPPLGIAGAGWAWLIAQSVGVAFCAGDVVLAGRRTGTLRTADASGEAP